MSNWPIDPVYPVVYIDGMHLDMVGTDRNVMLVAGRRDDGVMEILRFGVSTGEQCRDVLSNLRQRGLENVRLFVSDKSPAIRSVLHWVYPEVAWQHPVFHRLAELRKEIGATDYRDRLLAEAACIFRCPSREAALDASSTWRQRWHQQAPVAVAHFLEEIAESVNFYDLPITWWKRVRPPSNPSSEPCELAYAQWAASPMSPPSKEPSSYNSSESTESNLHTKVDTIMGHWRLDESGV